MRYDFNGEWVNTGISVTGVTCYQVSCNGKGCHTKFTSRLGWLMICSVAPEITKGTILVPLMQGVWDKIQITNATKHNHKDQLTQELEE
jgi:hypothetical protein